MHFVITDCLRSWLIRSTCLFNQKNQDFTVRNKKETNTIARLNRKSLISQKKSNMRTPSYFVPLEKFNCPTVMRMGNDPSVKDLTFRP